MSSGERRVVRRAYGRWPGMTGQLWADVHSDSNSTRDLKAPTAAPTGPEVAEIGSPFGLGRPSPTSSLRAAIGGGLRHPRAQPQGTSAVIEMKTGDIWTLRDGKVSTLETFRGAREPSKPPGCR